VCGLQENLIERIREQCPAIGAGFCIQKASTGKVKSNSGTLVHRASVDSVLSEASQTRIHSTVGCSTAGRGRTDDTGLICPRYVATSRDTASNKGCEATELALQIPMGGRKTTSFGSYWQRAIGCATVVVSSDRRLKRVSQIGRDRG
jgi:hypothetical protein